MNRRFFKDRSPASARLLIEMSRLTTLNVDSSVEALAREDTIPEDILVNAGICDPVEQRAVQFIFDMNFRCGIPAFAADQPRVKNIIRAALSIAEEGDPIAMEMSDLQKLGYDQMIEHRRQILVASVDVMDDECSMDLVSKMFPRIIAIGTMATQYSFSLGSTRSTSALMGWLLYPSVQASFSNTTWLRNSPRAMLAMGVFPFLLQRPDQSDLRDEHLY